MMIAVFSKNRIHFQITLPVPVRLHAFTIPFTNRTLENVFLQSALDILQFALYHVCKAGFAYFQEVSLDTKIKELRKEKKISQEQLALAVGTTRQTITSIEVGKYTASLALAYKIARYFGLTIEEVFDFSEIDTEIEL